MLEPASRVRASLDIAGIEFAFNGKKLLHEFVGAIGIAQHERGAGEEIHVDDGAVVFDAKSAAVQDERFLVGLGGLRAIAGTVIRKAEIDERGGEMGFILRAERTPDDDGVLVGLLRPDVIVLRGEFIAQVVEVLRLIDRRLRGRGDYCDESK